MAIKYIRSTDGDNVDDGSTWALAKADLHTTTWSAGDVLYVSQNHAQSSAANISIKTSGTLASPTIVMCANDGAEPPTSVATTATVATTGASNLITSGNAYFYGIAFNAGSGFVNCSFILNDYASANNATQVYESCDFLAIATGAGVSISVGGGGATNTHTNKTVWKNCRIQLASSSTSVRIVGEFRWDGGSVISGGTTPTTLFAPGLNLLGNARALARTEISCVDLSALSASVNLFSIAEGGLWIIRNCKLPTSWSGSLVSGTKISGGRYEMHNCDAGSTNYRLWVEEYAGSIVSETTIVRTGGANDGTTGLAWKMVSAANAEYPTLVLNSPEFVIWNDTTGASKTVTVEIVHDTNVAAGQGAGTAYAFQNDEIWLEVMYLSESGSPLGSWVSDGKASYLATAADHASSSATWTTTGMTTPLKQKMSVTFTPQKKGFIHARVVVAKASKTVYVDPVITVT